MEKVKVSRGGGSSTSGDVHVRVYGIAEMCVPCAVNKQKKHPKAISICTIIFIILAIISITIGPWLITAVVPKAAEATRLVFYFIIPIIIGIVVLIAFITIPRFKKLNSQLEQKKQEFLTKHGTRF